MAQPGKVPTCTAGDVGDAGLIPGWEDPLEEGIATHSSILAWEMPWKRILVGYSPWGLKESETTEWQILEWVAISFSKGSSQPGIKPESLVSPALQADSLPLCHLGRPCTRWTPLVSEWQSLSHVQLFVTPWTVACQTPLSMEFSRQEYWNGLPFPSPRHF